MGTHPSHLWHRLRGWRFRQMGGWMRNWMTPWAVGRRSGLRVDVCVSCTSSQELLGRETWRIVFVVRRQGVLWTSRPTTLRGALGRI